MASQDWVQDAELDLARQFDEKTGIGVNYQIFPSSQYNNLLMTKLNTGECPDIFAAQSGKFDIKSQYCVEKNAIDLSKWLKDYQAKLASQVGQLRNDTQLHTPKEILIDALLRESCQEAAWAPERVNALTASAATTLFLNDFIDGLISVTE